MAVRPVIPVRVGNVEIAVEATPVGGTEATAGRVAKAAGNVVDAFEHAQEVILEVARSTAEMIGKTGAAARPDRVEVEFGLKFSASGGVIMAGVAGEASLKVTLGYDVAARPARPAAEVAGEAALAVLAVVPVSDPPGYAAAPDGRAAGSANGTSEGAAGGGA